MPKINREIQGVIRAANTKAAKGTRLAELKQQNPEIGQSARLGEWSSPESLAAARTTARPRAKRPSKRRLSNKIHNSVSFDWKKRFRLLEALF